MSLYPSVNKYTSYPVGFQTILVGREVLSNPMELYFGLIKAKVLPPQRLYLRVLPYRHKGKLYFPVCKKCVQESSLESCTHSEEDRILTGAWVSTELEEDINQGYKFIEVFKVWHWKGKSSDLFRSYVDTFLKKKMKPSGWPAGVDSEEAKADYVNKIREMEGLLKIYVFCIK